MVDRIMVSLTNLALAVDTGGQTTAPWPGRAFGLAAARARLVNSSPDVLPYIPTLHDELLAITSRATAIDGEMRRLLDGLAALDRADLGLVSVSQLALDYLVGAPEVDPAVVAARLAELRAILDEPNLDAAARAVAIRDLFSGFDSDLQIAIGQAEPALIGNLDGAPVELRYAVNRARVGDELARLDEELLTRDDTHLLERVAELRRLLDTPYEHFGPDLAAGESRPRQILMFDPDGDGRIAEVFGDLDSADNLATFVPGITNTLNNFTNTENNALNIYNNAANPDTATIAWLGYDTPGKLDAVSKDAANQWSQTLADFQNSVGALAGPDVRTTVVAHSYGSLLTGTAIRNNDLVADAVVLIGSPGVGVTFASQLDMPDGMTLYAGRAKNDPVGLTASHGADPATPWFGAEVFNTDGISGHSSYTMPDSESVRNIGNIVSGNTDAVTHDGLDWGDFGGLATELPIIRDIKTVVTSAWDVGQVIVSGVGAVWDAVTWTVDLAIDIGAAISETITSITNTAIDLGSAFVDGAITIGGELIDGAIDLGQGALDLGGDILSGGLDLGSDILSGGLDLGGDILSGGLDLGSDILSGGLDAGGRVLEVGGDALDFLTPDIDWTPW